MKKLIVFGATGKTGLAVLARSSRDLDLQVTAFLRKPQKVPQDVKNRITIVIGNVLDENKVAEAIEGHDAVISCLGTGLNLNPGGVICGGVHNILEGMKKHGVKRIAVVGISFVLPGHMDMPFPFNKVGNDHKKALQHLKNAKDIEWIYAAPPEIAELPYTGTYKTAINKLAGSYVVSTHDLAEWMIDCVKDDEKAKECIHQLVGIGTFISPFKFLTGTLSGLIILGALACVGLGIAGFYVW